MCAESFSEVRWLRTSAKPSRAGIPLARAAATSSTDFGTHQFASDFATALARKASGSPAAAYGSYRMPSRTARKSATAFSRSLSAPAHAFSANATTSGWSLSRNQVGRSQAGSMSAEVEVIDGIYPRADAAAYLAPIARRIAAALSSWLRARASAEPRKPWIAPSKRCSSTSTPASRSFAA